MTVAASCKNSPSALTTVLDDQLYCIKATVVLAQYLPYFRQHDGSLLQTIQLIQLTIYWDVAAKTQADKLAMNRQGMLLMNTACKRFMMHACRRVLALLSKQLAQLTCQTADRYCEASGSAACKSARLRHPCQLRLLCANLMKWYTSSSSPAAFCSSGTMGSGRAKLLCAARMLSELLMARPAQ